MRRAPVCLFAFLITIAMMGQASAAQRRAWVALSNGPAGGSDEALVVTTTSDGSRIFVAGLDEVVDYAMSVAVIAYRYDGTIAWRASYASPSPFEATYVNDIVLSVDDREVILTAPLIGPDRDPLAVVGFDASSGALDWSWLSAPVTATPRDLATAPGRVFVVGTAGRRDTDRYVVALRPRSGDVAWTDRSDAPLGDTTANSAAVRDGRVFVAGSVATRDASVLRTVAYATDDGAVSWRATFSRARGGSVIGIAADGPTVLIQAAWKIIGYDTQTGARVMVERLDPAWRGMIRNVTVNPRGTAVFFTGNDERVGSSHSDMVTAAYDLGSRHPLWFARFDGGGWDEGIDVVWIPSVRPEIVVTGGSERDSVVGWRTVAYGSRTGKELWSDLYRGPLQEQGFPRAITASPGGNRVYVVGYTTTSRADDFATVAYRSDVTRRVGLSAR
jgi:hypothetical protein